MAKVLWIFLFVFFFTSPLFAQINEFLLDPVDLEISTGDSIIQVNININTVDSIIFFYVPVFAEGTCNPVLDTVLTGGLEDTDPPCFAEPSLVSTFWTKYVNPYGPPSDPMIFMAKNFVTSLPPSSGLFCRMFYKVSGPGILTFRTAVHSTAGGVGMWRSDYTSAPLNWPAEGEVGSFEVIQINEYLLDPVDLEITPDDSTVQVNINMNIYFPNPVFGYYVHLFAEGTCNPVLDTVLTGGLTDANPNAFNPPSLVAGCTQRIVNPYGPPAEPMLFIAWWYYLSSVEGLYCRMFYKVSGPGTLNFSTGVHSTAGSTRMLQDYPPYYAPINWPADGEVGSFEVTRMLIPGDVNWNGEINISDIVYIIAYLYKGGPAPVPEPSVADVNCDGEVTVSDVIYLLNYLFKGGPPPCE